jgi:hypothetical protein
MDNHYLPNLHLLLLETVLYFTLRQAQGERIKTGHPFETVRPEALEGTNGAQDRPELIEP